MKPTPEIIPHQDFHKGNWLARRSFFIHHSFSEGGSAGGLLSAEEPGWYYFLKRPRGYRIPPAQFLKSVDEPLRELVAFLHQKKISTTPSCSGHSKSKKEFDKIYGMLEEDKKKINHGGLSLTDVETGENLLYIDKAYSLPWSREEFITRVKRQQEKGILGLYLTKRKIRHRMMQLKVNGADVYERGSIVFIRTNSPVAWKEVTPAVKKIIGEGLDPSGGNTTNVQNPIL